MPREFHTERDIEDMFKRGIHALSVNDNVVLTELAYEKARSLGMKLLRESPDNPPSAPVRPYIAKTPAPRPPAGAPTGALKPALQAESLPAEGDNLRHRIRAAVAARLGSQVDSNLLDVIIKRVLQSTGATEATCCSAGSGAPRCAPSNTPAPRD